MANANSEPDGSRPDPKYRHEFVGMMFAVTIGEVGLQTAALVQTHEFAQYLPAVSHLILATIMIATSWVGWTLSRAPGAQLDVNGIFEREFLVLLVDVVLVIVYFILVRTVDFGTEGHPRIDPPSTVAFWILVIFWLYLFWDVLTNKKEKSWKDWREKAGRRMAPTVMCLILAYATKYLIANSDYRHWVTADLALLSLVLLFRALKSRSVSWVLISSLALIAGVLWTRSAWPT
jgi:hypothetical protein